MSRRSLGLALVAALLSLGTRARADIPANAGTLAFEIRVPDPNHASPTEAIQWIPPDTIQALYGFNLAHCLCSAYDSGNERKADFALRVTLTGGSRPSGLVSRKVDLYAGDSCDDLTTRNMNCQQITPSQQISDYDTLFVTSDHEMPLQPVMDVRGATCSPNQGSSAVWFLADTDGTGTLASVGSISVPFDKQPPPLPTEIKAQQGEGAINLTWTLPTSNATDIAYFQALCETTDGVTWSGAGGQGSTGPRYDTPEMEGCTGVPSSGIELQHVDIDPTQNPDAGTFDAMPDGAPDADSDAGMFDAMPDAQTAPTVDAAPAGSFEGLDQSFICGEQPGTSPSLRIEGLKNGVPYKVILLSIDKSGNAAGVEFNETITPQPVTDFWEDLHDQGSDVESGFCLISDTYGDGGPITNAMRAFRDDTLGGSALGRAFTRFYYAHVAWLGAYARAHWPLRVLFAIVLAPFVMIALAWHVLTLPGLIALIGLAWWLRRRRRGRSARVAVAATTAMLLFAISAGVAHAQDDPWTEPEAGDDSVDTDGNIGVIEPSWIVGIKLGPYVPAIDAQFQAQTGSMVRPYHQMFGGYNLMPMIDVDRVLWSDFGQVTVGGSIGFLSKSANAFVVNSKPTDDPRERSDGDTNEFRMFPVAALLGYRFTYLDDRWGIPIVPYARGGLAYYAWWVTAPDGDLSFVGDGNCHPDTATMKCTKQTAMGGSIGLQGSVGIAIRAERIDPQAAASMREGGIEHAGFYAEWQAGWVDGFGDSKRFSLGDSTWFAGVSFEF